MRLILSTLFSALLLLSCAEQRLRISGAVDTPTILPNGEQESRLMYEGDLADKETSVPKPSPTQECKAFMANEDYNCNTRSLMATIAHAEGTKNSYNIIFTFKKFTSYRDHPRKVYCSRNGKLCSSAAGRYQFLDKTWDSIRGQVKNITNFEPYNQDIAGVHLVQVTRGVKDHSTRYNKQQFAKALYKLRHEWASMPESPYGQPTHSVSSLWKVYESGF